MAGTAKAAASPASPAFRADRNPVPAALGAAPVRTAPAQADTPGRAAPAARVPAVPDPAVPVPDVEGAAVLVAPSPVPIPAPEVLEPPTRRHRSYGASLP
ncbi:hypothetical protein GCM10009780_72290 [Actinomadura alba]